MHLALLLSSSSRGGGNVNNESKRLSMAPCHVQTVTYLFQSLQNALHHNPNVLCLCHELIDCIDKIEPGHNDIAFIK